MTAGPEIAAIVKRWAAEMGRRVSVIHLAEDISIEEE